MCVLHDGVSDTTKSSIFSRSFSAMPSAANARWRSSTSGSSRLPSRSWPGRARDRLPSRSALSRFLAALTEASVEACAPCFWTICSVDHSRPTSKQEACWIEQETPGSCATSVGHERPLANAPYPRLMSFPRLSAGWMTCALLGTEAANAGRVFDRARRLLRPTATSGSARSATQATDATGRNYVRCSRPLVSISWPTSSHSHTPCFGLTGSMEPGPSSPMWQASRLSPAAKSTVCSITRSFRHACTFRQINSNNAQKARWSAASTMAHRSRRDPMACAAVWWWPPIPPRKRRVRLASRVEVSSTNSSSPTCESRAFTAADVVELYLHRGAFEPALFDEDQEIEPDRWCSHSAS